MKKVLFILFVLFSVQASAQYFEGEIIYQNTFKSKVAEMKDDQLAAMMGSRQEYFIRDGAYKSVMNGMYLQWQLYVPADNKLYNKLANSETLMWNDGGASVDSILDSKLTKNATEILGYTCDELILICKSGIQKYYFSPLLALDPSKFSKHKFGNWDVYTQKTKSIPLKMIIDSPQFTIESMATEVKPMKLDEKEFRLPENAKTEKSPY